MVTPVNLSVRAKKKSQEKKNRLKKKKKKMENKKGTYGKEIKI